ncbi:hypothetical protein Zmor_003968 [Zophobas morio]|uniref:Uncharacterized protein n=1 Tax=Zophobas morio TaxID=2755281 RepID=A0AA38HIT1_9CUCU|nr:hypothetical protein Zmor_003968 [Zophobas morio]
MQTMKLKDMFKYQENLNDRMFQLKRLLSDLDDEGIPDDEKTVIINGTGRIRIELEKLAPLLREELAEMEATGAAIKHALETAQSVADGLMNKSA